MGLFSAVSSAFVIDVHSKLEPDPNEQSAAILRAILLTLNHSAIPGETPTVPLVQKYPPSEIVTVTGLMYASLLISLLAAFIAMLGKQWLNRYLRNAGGSTIERCGDRQRKCDGLKKWPFHLFVESLPIMLQVSLLLLACGLCRRMWSINPPVAYILLVLTTLGILFYAIIVIVGTSSYECPFQTPASTALRSLWKKIGHRIIHIATVGFNLCQALPSTTLHLWRILKDSAGSAVLRSKRTILLAAQNLTQWVQLQVHPPPPIVLDEVQEDSRMSQESSRESFHFSIRTPTPPPPEETPAPALGSTEPWLKPMVLTTLRKTNTNDVQCVSWILSNITDPEALDAAIRLAGMIRWFEDGLDVDPPYTLFVSTLRTCFSPAGRVYPGLRDRAYHTAQAVLWIHTLALCKPIGFAHRFSLPTIPLDTTFHDPDLRQLLQIYTGRHAPNIILSVYWIHPGFTPTHLQWTSNILLHLSWAKHSVLEKSLSIPPYNPSRSWNTIPVGAVLNRLLAFCIFVDWPIKEEVLKIQDKMYVISCIRPQSHSHHCLPGITLTRLYPNSPRQWLQPSAAPTLNASSSKTC